MDFPLSETLAAALREAGMQDLGSLLNMAILTSAIERQVSPGDRRSMVCLRAVTGLEAADKLLLEIGNVLPFDSVVRDIGTTGHVAKILSRKESFARLHDWRVVGLPHRVFDLLSWNERNQFFKQGVCHTMDADLFRIPEVLKMLASERAVLSEHSSTELGD